MTRAYIAGMGIISAIGNNTTQNQESLTAGKTGIGAAGILQSRHAFPVGEINRTNEALAREAGVSALWPRTALLSLLAAQEAWLPLSAKAKGLRIAFISANTVGGMDLTERFYKAFREDQHAGAPEDVRYHECGAITELVREALGLNCWSTTISTACSSSANSIMMAARLIEENQYDAIICGGADALSRFTLNGFNALMILDKELCRPFDQDRRGLNLGEGAAYLVLGNEKAVEQLGAKAEVIVSGYANANDAHHQTASSPEGKGNQLAMQKAMERAGIGTDEIGYINLHGTGTENNDSSEGIAIQTLFQGKVPAGASSTKAYTGHTLAAAGAIEAVFSILSINQQVAWPHLRMTKPIETLSWQPNTQLTPQDIRHVLSNSFGFGGNCTSLVFSAC
jgi:3-oxoacyl-[acyl-carrier-protein] synthase-1